VSLSPTPTLPERIRNASGRGARPVRGFTSVNLAPENAPWIESREPRDQSSNSGQTAAAAGNDAGQTALELGTAKAVREPVADSA